MINTYTSYQLITRDIGKSLARVEQQPLVQRETEYFAKNIGNVKSAEEFVENTRLFNYAMKAFGLQDMAYAKAFMLKALKEGISNPDSFANKLADKRYAEFAAVFDFAAHGEKTTSYNTAHHGTVENYLARATGSGTFPVTETARRETEYFSENIVKVESIDDLLADDRMLTYALRAFRIEGLDLSKAALRSILEGGVEDPASPANKHRDENVAKFAATFDFATLGEKTTTHVRALHEPVANYMRQTLEEDAGNQNEGVRLALYFERKAPDITSFYEILADPALAAVVRTALSLPDEIAQADIDKQVAMFEKRLDIEDFTDPERLSKLLTRFTTMWEINNPTTSATSLVTTLFAPQPQFGISPQTMMAIAMLRK